MYEFGILLIGALTYYFNSNRKQLLFKFQFVFGDVKQNIRGDWYERAYDSIERYYDDEAEIIELCMDIERNKTFRDIGVTGISVTLEGDEIFYVHMKNNEE